MKQDTHCGDVYKIALQLMQKSRNHRLTSPEDVCESVLLSLDVAATTHQLLLDDILGYHSCVRAGRHYEQALE
jgi:hypothetical protein